MNKRTRLIIAGAAVSVLAIVVVYLNFFRAEATAEDADAAFKAAQEHAQNTPPPAPEPVTPAPKKMEEFKKGP